MNESALKPMKIHLNMELKDGLEFLENYAEIESVFFNMGDIELSAIEPDCVRYTATFKNSDTALMIIAARSNISQAYVIKCLEKYFNFRIDSAKPKKYRIGTTEKVTEFPD